MSALELARRLSDTDTIGAMVDLLTAVGPHGREEFRRWLARASDFEERQTALLEATP